jgi:hypothetical protein
MTVIPGGLCNVFYARSVALGSAFIPVIFILVSPFCICIHSFSVICGRLGLSFWLSCFNWCLAWHGMVIHISAGVHTQVFSTAPFSLYSAKAGRVVDAWKEYLLSFHVMFLSLLDVQPGPLGLVRLDLVLVGPCSKDRSISDWCLQPL